MFPFLLLFLPMSIQTSVVYQTGDFATTLPYYCQNDTEYNPRLYFPQQFNVIPQMIIVPEKYDSFSPNEFLFQIGNITTSSFDLYIKCLQTQILYQIRFRWIALVDSRFEIISSFNQNVSGKGNTTFTFTHSDPNHVQGFVTFLSLGYSDDFYFKLNISSITFNEVVVSVTQYTNTMLSIGFQIVLGTMDAFTLGTVIDQENFALSDSGIITTVYVPPQKQLILPYQALNFSIMDNLRIDQTYLLNNDSTVNYVIQTWWTTVINSLTLQQVFINNNVKVYYPILFSKFRISKKIAYYRPNFLVQLKILELNMLYTQVGNYVIQLSQSQQKINLIITFKCSLSKYVKASILKCIICKTKFLYWKQQCHSGINLIELYVQFFQLDQFIQDLNLEITSFGLTLTQTITNLLGQTTNTVIATSIDEV